MAKLAPEDKFAGLAPKDRLATAFPDLDLEDRHEPPAETLVEWARTAEGAAMAVKGRHQFGRRRRQLQPHSHRARHQRRVLRRLCRHVVRRRRLGGGRRRHQYGARLRPGERTPRRRPDARRRDRPQRRRARGQAAGAAKSEIAGRAGGVDPRVSGGLVGHFVGAISGSSIARGVSFLKEMMGKQIFDASINIIDDPHRLRGCAPSRSTARASRTGAGR